MKTQSPLEILYDQGACLVVLKPAGLATQSPPGIESLESRVKDFLRSREKNSAREPYLGVPHRLDRPVSGAIVFARNVQAAQELAAQFRLRTVRKVYWVCVQGKVMPREGEWRDLMMKVPNEPRSVICNSTDTGARLAVLKYRTLGESSYGSFLEVELETGRMHQIRLQASTRKFPVIGDRQYGSALPFGVQHPDERLRAIALHARLLEFNDPVTQMRVRIKAELPVQWTALKILEE